MSVHDDFVYLCHMRDACSKVQEYVAGFTWDKFANDGRTQDAVIRQLEVLGEASSRVSQNYKELHAVLPWREVKAFRNVVAHQYDRIMPDVVWKVTQKDVPEIMNHLESLIERYDKEEQQKGMVGATEESGEKTIYCEPEDRKWEHSDDRDDR